MKTWPTITFLAGATLALGCCCPVVMRPSGTTEDRLDEPAISTKSNSESPPIAGAKFDVQVTKVALMPWRTPAGADTQMVYVNWRNTGNRPIGALYADIIAYDVHGRRLGSGAEDYCIFAASNRASLIHPGFVYNEPSGYGFVLLSNLYGDAASVDVRITRAKDTTLADAGF